MQSQFIDPLKQSGTNTARFKLNATQAMQRDIAIESGLATKGFEAKAVAPKRIRPQSYVRTKAPSIRASLQPKGMVKQQENSPTNQPLFSQRETVTNSTGLSAPKLQSAESQDTMQYPNSLRLSAIMRKQKQAKGTTVTSPRPLSSGNAAFRVFSAKGIREENTN